MSEKARNGGTNRQGAPGLPRHPLPDRPAHQPGEPAPPAPPGPLLGRRPSGAAQGGAEPDVPRTRRHSARSGRLQSRRPTGAGPSAPGPRPARGLPPHVHGGPGSSQRNSSTEYSSNEYSSIPIRTRRGASSYRRPVPDRAAPPMRRRTPTTHPPARATITAWTSREPRTSQAQKTASPGRAPHRRPSSFTTAPAAPGPPPASTRPSTS